LTREDEARKLAVGILLSIIAGIIVHTSLDTPLLYYLVAVVAAMLLSLWNRRFLYLIVLVLSAVNVYSNRPPDADFNDRDMVYSGIVYGENHYEHYTKLLLHIDRIFTTSDTIEYHSRAEHYAFGEEVYFGKRLTIKGQLRPSRYAHRPAHLGGKIISSSTQDHVFGVIFNPVRSYVDRLLSDLFRDDQYRIASGLILGGSGRLGEELKEVFSRAGVLHILAVSGLHVGFAAIFLGAFLFFVPLDHRIKFAIVMCGLIVYAGVTGFRPSVSRATLMAFLFGMALVSERNVSSMHVVNITATVFLLVNPLLFFDVGAQLSFGAVYGILWLYPRIEKGVINKVRQRIYRIILRPMAVSFSAQVFVAPFVIYYFHRLPLYAVLTNLLIVPIASTIIFLLFLCFAVGWMWFAAAKVIALPASIFITVLVALSDFAASIPFSSIRLSISPLMIIPFYCLFWKQFRKPALWLVVILMFLFSLARSVDCLTVCSAARGILITTPGGEHVFITNNVSVTQHAFLERQGVTELEYLIASSRDYTVSRGFVALPERMHFTELTYGDLGIRISDRVRIAFGSSQMEYAWSDLKDQSDKGRVTHLLCDGESAYVVQGNLYGTITEQMFVDLQLILHRLAFFF
jgi:ComEC/Rec2-related protein